MDEDFLNMDLFSEDINDDCFDLDFDFDNIEEDDLFIDPLPQEKLKFFLKAAKGKEFQAEKDFPSAMLCSPYKYHLKILGSLPNEKMQVELVFAKTQEKPNTTKAPLVLEETVNISPTETLLKFSLHICSFHYKRREFQFVVSCGVNKIFSSIPFRSYARRRNKSNVKSPQRFPIKNQGWSMNQGKQVFTGYFPQQQQQQIQPQQQMVVLPLNGNGGQSLGYIFVYKNQLHGMNPQVVKNSMKVGANNYFNQLYNNGNKFRPM